MKACEDFAARAALSDTARSQLRALRAFLASLSDRDARKLRERIDAVLDEQPKIALNPGEAWTDAALGDIEASPDAETGAWAALIEHCRGASGGKPSSKWTRDAATLARALGPAFRQRLLAWLPLVERPRTRPIERRSDWGPDPNQLLDDVNADVLKGLVWAASLQEDAELARALSRVALSAYRKVPGIGPRATKVGNACLWALGEMPGEASLGALAVLKVRVKFGTAQKGIEKALAAVAERTGVSREELEELGAPAYGLEEVGVRRETLAGTTAELLLHDTGKVELRWLRAEGKPQKGVPSSLKETHADDIKELKRAAKDIEAMFHAQRDRIDALFMARKEWPIDTWRERYLDHPLVGVIARRLIWVFEDGARRASAIWDDGQLRTAGGEPVVTTDKTVVRLWHPIDAIVRLCQSPLPSLQLFEQISKRVRAAVSYEWGGWLCTDPATQLKLGALLEDVPQKAYLQLFDNELVQDDFSKFEQIASSGRRVTSLSSETRKDLDRSRRYREIYRPHGLRDEIRMVFRSGDVVLGVGCLVRGTAAPHFSDSDLAFTEAVSAHVAQGLRARLLLGETDENLTVAPGIIVLAADDTVESITTEGARLLGEITPDDGACLELPTAIYHLALRVRSNSSFPPRGRVRLRSGRWLLVHASRLVTPDGNADRVAILLEPAQPSQLAPLLIDLYGLTERERDVTQLLVRGLGIDEIGEALYISRHTVRDHVKAIFAKTAVSSRPELMAKLYHEHVATRLRTVVASDRQPSARPSRAPVR